MGGTLSQVEEGHVLMAGGTPSQGGGVHWIPPLSRPEWGTPPGWGTTYHPDLARGYPPDHQDGVPPPGWGTPTIQTWP